MVTKLELHILKLQNWFKISLPCLRQEQRSFSICYPPLSEVRFYCFTKGTPCFLRVQFLTLFDGSPYLVLLGGRLIVFGHSLEKYERRPFWEPAANLRNHNFTFRLPSTTTSKTENLLKFLTFSSRTFKTSTKLKPSNKIPSFLRICQKLLRRRNISTIQRKKETTIQRSSYPTKRTGRGIPKYTKSIERNISI